jgi:predicted metal-dependent TIM-barrel fold hydrolase
MIDTHIHADTRSSEDFEKMFIGGIDKAITCCYYPYKINNESVLINHMMRILNFDTKRGAEYGLSIKVALGIHPTNSLKSNDKIIETLKRLIDEKRIIAIGEIGLEDVTNDEIDIFKKQLNLAEETRTKVIIHTPRKNKSNILKKIKTIVLELIDPKLVVIDHINQKVVEEVIDENFMLGLTVQPQKMDVSEAIAILNSYGSNDFILNSDISNKPSDPLSVPKTIRAMEKLDFKKKNINKVAFENAKKFFNI